MFILRTMVHELESIGYAVEERVVDTSQYGVPQFRQRLILVALRDRNGVHLASSATGPGDGVERDRRPSRPWRAGGGRKAAPTAGRPTKRRRTPSSGGCAREWTASMADRVYDQITRPVRDDDKIAFEHMDAKTRYSDLPEELRRYRADIFDDKYKRLDENGLSRTITAHIAKDGYWYIHPKDSRTLTVREAARIQTFPDRYRFAGPPSAAFRQIGNAVPPFLGEQLGMAIRASLDEPHAGRAIEPRHRQGPRRWFRAQPIWLSHGCGRDALAGDLGGDSPGTSRRPAAAAGSGRWSRVGEARRHPCRHQANWQRSPRWVDRASRAERLLEIAERLADTPEVLDSDRDDPHRAPRQRRRSRTWRSSRSRPATDDDDSEEPVLAGRGVLRVAVALHRRGDARAQEQDERRAARRRPHDRLRRQRPRRAPRAHRVGRRRLPTRGSRVRRCPLAADMRQLAASSVTRSCSDRRDRDSKLSRSRPRELATAGCLLRQHRDDAAERFVLASLHRGSPQRQASVAAAGTGDSGCRLRARAGLAVP